MSWSIGQAKQFVRELRQHVGDGWAWLTPEVRLALVDQKVISVVFGQEREEVRIDDIRMLRLNMLSAAKVHES